jgi:predicted transcriptional regulator
MSHLSFLVPKALRVALQELADADRRQLSNYLRIALEAHVKRKQGKKR